MTYTPPTPPAQTGNPAGRPPLSLPLYGASFGQAVARFWKKYATFTGRASRSEFWWWYLANAIVVAVLYIVLGVTAFTGATYDPNTGGSAPGQLFGLGIGLFVLWSLATIVPTLAVTWRRLHDSNRSGAFAFLGFLPVVGIILVVFLILDRDPAGVRFDAPA